MADGERPDLWDGGGLLRLVTANLIGGASWALGLQTGYSLVKPACRADQILWLTGVNALALVGALAGLWLGLSTWRRLRTSASTTGERAIDRSQFMALTAIGLNALFALLILLSTVPQLLQLPCE
jgi:hypothetical protein